MQNTQGSIGLDRIGDEIGCCKRKSNLCWYILKSHRNDQCGRDHNYYLLHWLSVCAVDADKRNEEYCFYKAWMKSYPKNSKRAPTPFFLVFLRVSDSNPGDARHLLGLRTLLYLRLRTTTTTIARLAIAVMRIVALCLVVCKSKYCSSNVDDKHIEVNAWTPPSTSSSLCNPSADLR
jgi:hypothetical protein